MLVYKTWHPVRARAQKAGGAYDGGQAHILQASPARAGKETVMPKKKRKIRTLTEEQYNDYLMSLKDERPTMLIGKDGKRTPQK